MLDLTNAALITRLKSHLSTERRTLAEFLRTLAEVDRRKLHVDLGHEYLGQYCEKELGLSEGEAWNRAKVARVAQRLPVVLDMIADGRHSLTSVRNLAPYLDGPDAVALLARSASKSTRDVQRLVAELQEAAERAKREIVSVPQGAGFSFPPAAKAQVTDRSTAPSPAEPPRRKRETIRHVTPTSFSVTFELDEATRATLDRIIEIRRKQGKDATVAAAMKDMMELYLDKHDEQRKLERRAARAAKPKCGTAASKRKSPTTAPNPMPASPAHPAARYVPAKAELAVYERDGYRCAYVGPTGHRCAATVGLQRDHPAG